MHQRTFNSIFGKTSLSPLFLAFIKSHKEYLPLHERKKFCRGLRRCIRMKKKNLRQRSDCGAAVTHMLFRKEYRRVVGVRPPDYLTPELIETLKAEYSMYFRLGAFKMIPKHEYVLEMPDGQTT